MQPQDESVVGGTASKGEAETENSTDCSQRQTEQQVSKSFSTQVLFYFSFFVLHPDSVPPRHEGPHIPRCFTDQLTAFPLTALSCYTLAKGTEISQ